MENYSYLSVHLVLLFLFEGRKDMCMTRLMLDLMFVVIA